MRTLKQTWNLLMVIIRLRVKRKWMTKNRIKRKKERKSCTYTQSACTVQCTQIGRLEYMPHFARYFQCHINDATLFRSIVSMQSANDTASNHFELEKNKLNMNIPVCCTSRIGQTDRVFADWSFSIILAIDRFSWIRWTLPDITRKRYKSSENTHQILNGA